MNDVDRQFLTKWGGECWDGATHDKICRGLYIDPNRTFDSPDDTDWLMSRLNDTGLTPLFISWLKRTNEYTSDPSATWAWYSWITITQARRCQLICNFLREREIL